MDITIEEFFRKYPCFSLQEYKNENPHLKCKKPSEWMHHYHMEHISVSYPRVAFLVFMDSVSSWEEIIKRHSAFHSSSFYYIFYEYEKDILEKNIEKYALSDCSYVRYRKTNQDDVTSRMESIYSVVSEIDTEYYCVLDEKHKLHFSFLDVFAKDEKINADVYVYLSSVEYIIILSSRYRYLYQSITPYPNSHFVERIKYLGLWVYESCICYLHSNFNKKSYYITQHYQMYNHLKYQLRQFKNHDPFPYQASLKTFVYLITGQIDTQIRYIYACYLFCLNAYGNVLFSMDDSSPVYSFYDAHEYLPKASVEDKIQYEHLTTSFLDEIIQREDNKSDYHFFHYLMDEETKDKIIQGKDVSHFRTPEEYFYYMNIDDHPLFGLNRNRVLYPSMQHVCHVYFIENQNEIKRCIYQTDVYANVIFIFIRKCEKLYLEKIMEHENCYVYEGKVLSSWIDYIQSIAWRKPVHMHRKENTFVWDVTKDRVEEMDVKVKHWYSYLQNHYSKEGKSEILKEEVVSLSIPERLVYIVNLDERKDRLKHCREEWRRLNTHFSFQRFQAIRLSREEAKKEVDWSLLWKRDPSYMVGSASCKYSHRMLLREVCGTVQPWVWIMEDDFVFENSSLMDITEDIVSHISRLNQIDPEWHLLYLGVHLLHQEDAFLVDPHLLKLKPNGGLTTTSYIVQTKYIPKIISILEESKVEIDNTYMKEVDHRYCIYPMKVYQCDSYSDILCREVSYSAYHTKFVYGEK